MRIFGLTGGIGCGKSTVASRFEARGVPVVDADVLARRAAADPDVLRSVASRFGPSIVRDGVMDRKALASVVFSDRSALADLEAIMHPAIRWLADFSFASVDGPLGCYVVPLLYETGLESKYSPVVVVATSAEEQLDRIRMRDRCSARDASLRVASQMPLAEKVARADFVIMNSGTIEGVMREADSALDSVFESLGMDPSAFPRPGPT